MLIYDIALTFQPQVGPRTAAYLLSCFGTAERIFNVSADELVQKAELNPRIAASIARREGFRQAENELRYCERNGIIPIASTSELYPGLLLECDDYPHVLYYIGDPEILGRRKLSVVGTRKITSYGSKVCDRLIGGLSAMYPDLVIVSGLAYGVDAAAHRAALGSGLRTIGVLPCALPGVYPAQHNMLATEMLKQGGGLLTEYHSGSPNNGTNFVPRNRIIAGLSEGILVVESPERGGSLISANMADGYNRCVMAVPGRVGDACSEGPNQLIKNQKARMVCSAEDIARELMWDLRDAAKPEPYDLSQLSDGARNVLGLIPDGSSISIDELSAVSGLSIPDLSSVIFELECEMLIRMLPGKRYERA